jgi:hypothetical protein
MAISIQLDSQSQMTRLAVYPLAMANVRGLIYGLFTKLSSTSLLTITAVLSIALIALAAKSLYHTMAIAITVAILVSYHSMDHDLVLMLIPIFTALNSAKRNVRSCGVLVLAAPFIFGIVLPYPYLTSIPIVALLILLCRPYWRVQTEEVSPTCPK